MERRELLRVAASAAALSLLPSEKAVAAWARVASGVAPTNGLNDAQMAFVRALADTLIPRTDTPSATDVGTHHFIDVIASEFATDDERKTVFAGIDAIDTRARTESNVVFADLAADARGKMIDALESGDRNAEPAQTYWRLKGLVVHGYFTSEPVMKDVLKVQVMPGRFDGSVPVNIRKRPLQAGSPAPKGSGQERRQEEHLHG
ncbi:MAG TPA: gluconate 2-dehydrogenase subunit 3 family protein [Gemmatimonadaceae bacterium]|nr:gluconate 2-dehydrogenase subunit 3 family protein [Gemmatimonadaceae bacterium]